MTVPTVAVTVRLADFGGPAIAGVIVKARLSDVDYTAAGTFVSTEPVSGVTDASGVAVLNVFPNAVAPTGLGTKGTTILFSASLPGSRSLKVEAMVPNTPCNLVDVLVPSDEVALTDAQLALLAVGNSVSQAAGSATAAAGSASAAAHIYAGTFATDPTTRPDGSAIQNGDQYTTTAGAVKVFTLGVWVTPTVNMTDLANSADNTKGASLIGHQSLTLYDRVSGRVFAVKDNTQAGILAARAKAVAAGGGTVLLPDATITLTSALPADPYVFYEGVEPRRTLGVIPDNTWTFTGGTILKGNGAFNGFEGNVTPQGAAATTAGGVYANQSIQGFGLRSIGFDTLLSGVAMGATNILGPVFCHFENLWAVNCTSWGFKFVNWMHSHFDRLFVANSAHGIYFGADEPTATLLNGNSRISRLYVNQPNLLGRGIVFEGATGASQGEIEAVRLQVNRFGTAGGTQSATMTNASTSIGVTDLTKFAVGCPVSFTTTANGFTADLTYMVLTVSGSSGAGNITVATKRSGAAIAATGNAAITIRSLGMPNMEICGMSSNAASGCRFLNLDLEGASGVTLYMENTGNCEVQLTALSSATSNVVQRSARHTVLTCLASNAITDFDSVSYETVWMGPRQGTIRQRRGWGMWRNSADRVGLSLRSTLTGDGWDIFEQSVNGGSVLGLGTAMGAKVNASIGGTIAVDGGRAGVVPVVFGGGSALTLFTIATADIGTEFLFVNVGTSGTATLNTDGTQVFNGQTGKTQLVIPIGGAVRVIAQSTSNWLAAGSFLLDTVSGSKTFDPASIANGAQTTTTVTATGAVLGDQVDAWTNIDQAGIQVTGYVSAADTVTVIYSNTTGGAVDLASHTVRVRARKN